ncbi:MAG: stage II sporulation protein M [Chloroflexota bacterium]
MHVDEFYQSRKADWETLSQLLDRSQRAIQGLTPQDVQSLGRLYRAVTSDLALAQRDFPRHRVTQYLNQLVARAHAVVYRGEPLALKRLGHFFFVEFPRTFRATFPFTLAAMLLFFLPALGAGVSAAVQPESATWLLPPELQENVRMIEEGELWTDIPPNERPFASSFIMTNNIKVAFLSFAGGITAGMLTLYVMVFNGIMLGAITGLTIHYGIGFDLWTFVIGHGVIELSVICFSGGSGLMLGWAILRPGLLRRRDALTLAAGQAVKLLMGAVPWLVVAGTIEGFLSPAENVPPLVKWMVGITSGIVLYSYLFLAGREKKKGLGL